MTTTATATATALLAFATAFATALFAATIRGRVKLKRGTDAFNIRRAQRAATGLNQFFVCAYLCCVLSKQVLSAAALPPTKQRQRYQTAVLLMGFSAGAGAGTGTAALLVGLSRLAQNVLQLHARVGSLGAHHVRHPRVGFFSHGWFYSVMSKREKIYLKLI